MNEQEIKDTIRKIWDRSSATYDTNPGHEIVTLKEKEAWEHELGQNLPLSSLRVLDVGCGTGVISLLFAELGHHVTGIDLSREMLALARKKAEKNKITLELQIGDAEHLPYSDGSFDVIVSRHLLWTLPYPEIALKDWYRVLLPGGIFLIIDGVWDDNKLLTWVKIAISSAMTRVFEPDNTHRRSYDMTIRKSLPHEGGVPKEIMIDSIRSAGFSNIQFSDLKYIMDLQREQLPWYKRIAHGRSHYLITSTKPYSDSVLSPAS